MPTVTEADMRKLWPGPARKLEPAVVVAKRKQPKVSGGFERSVTVLDQKSPVIESGNFRSYWVLGGALKIKLPPSDAGSQFSGAWESGGGDQLLVAKYEQKLNEYLTFEGTASPSREACYSLASGDWKGAAKEMFSARIKTGGNIFWNVNFEFEGDVSPDENLCFFGITGKLIIPFKAKDYVSSMPDRLEFEAEASLNYRFGLSRQGWVKVAKETGGAALKAGAQSIGQVGARTAVITMLEGFGIPLMGAAAGVGLMYLTGALAAHYSTKGTRQGILTNYCTGYLVKVFEARTKQKGHFTANKIKTRSKIASSEHYMGGYEDAERAIRKFGLDAIEAILLRHFGMNHYYFSASTRKFGQTIDDEYGEARKIADDMAKYMAYNIDAFGKYVGINNVGWTYF